MANSRKFRTRKLNIAVILHNIRSIHNVGSIFRTADAAGVLKIYLCGITPAPLDRFGKIRPQFAKVALGAEKFVSWEKAVKMASVIGKLKKAGYKVFAAEQARRSIPYYRVRYHVSPNSKAKLATRLAEASAKRAGQAGVKKVTVIFGNEVRGLPPSVLKQADKVLEIPMRGKKESLNVAVAFGIVVFSLIEAQ